MAGAARRSLCEPADSVVDFFWDGLRVCSETTAYLFDGLRIAVAVAAAVISSRLCCYFEALRQLCKVGTCYVFVGCLEKRAQDYRRCSTFGRRLPFNSIGALTMP